MAHALDISWANVILPGVGQGLAYAVLAAGMVLIYRCSGVINLAQSAFGVFGLSLLVGLVGVLGMAYLPALAVVIVAGALLGTLVELIVVRRLFTASRLVLLMATVGVTGILATPTGRIPQYLGSAFTSFTGRYPTGHRGGFPTLLPWTWTVNEDLVVGPAHFSAFIGCPLLILGLALFLNHTRWGLMIRASSSNPEKSRLNGIRIRRTSTMVWAISSAFAGLGLILVVPLRNPTVFGAASGSGFSIVSVLLVALFARMRSLPLVIVGGLLVGVGETWVFNNLLPWDFPIIHLATFVAICLLVLTFRDAAGTGEERSWKVAPRVKPLPENLQDVWWLRNLPRIALCATLFLLVLLPALFHQPSQLYSWSRVLIFAIAGLSLTVLTGWAGQLSLGQFGFAALGGLTTLTLTQGKAIPVPFRLFHASWHVPWVAAVLLSIVVGVGAAVLVGIPALRIPGLYLAITTLSFSFFVGIYVVSRQVFIPEGGYYDPVKRPVIGPVDLNHRLPYYYLCLGALVVALVLVAQLRRTGIGRTIIAVRNNELAASAMTLSPARVKLVAFGLSGGLAALAGSLLVTTLVTVDPNTAFTGDDSFRVVSIAVIGGLGSLAGPVFGALWVIGIPAITGGSVATNRYVSSSGLLVLLLVFPGGLTQIGYLLRDVLAPKLYRRPITAERQRKTETAVPAGLHVRSRPIGELTCWLRTTDVRVAFGGRVAVDDVSITVGPRELVGLIGTNGSGKSTLMNAIGGFVRCEGRVEILGQDAHHRSPARRHRLGLGRGFQAARLYDDLTVRETLLVALEAHERSRLLPSLFNVPPSRAAERHKRAEADEIISYVGLGRFADELIANLSTGTRRIAELGCQLALAPRVLMLDEPTGGLAQRETEAFGPLIKQVQRELDAAVVVIEHDMPLVMSISDRVYCMEAGAVIAEGTPDAVRRDPRVIASYLGTDEPSAAPAPTPV